MRHCNLQGLPEDIGRLIHLRYLNVSKNPIKELPETVTDLCNLQTLDIEGCQSLSSLPEGIEKLINLRHLHHRATGSLVTFPEGLEKLSGLWTLTEFRSSKFGCLRNLNQLQGSLTLIPGDFHEGEFDEPKLWEKQTIEKLELLFGEVEDMNGLVEALRPPPKLQSLAIMSRSGKWLSRWITSFDSLKVLWFNNCFEGGSNVPPLFCKLPALEELSMYACGFKRLGVEFLGLEEDGFPRLKKLSFEECYEWQEWEDIEQEYCQIPVLTSLEELQFLGCWNLEALPLRLIGKATSLRAVKLSCSERLCMRYNEISGSDRDKIPLLPNQVWTVPEEIFQFGMSFI